MKFHVMSDGILQLTECTKLCSTVRWNTFGERKKPRWLQNASNLFELTLAMQLIRCAHIYSLENIVKTFGKPTNALSMCRIVSMD